MSMMKVYAHHICIQSQFHFLDSWLADNQGLTRERTVFLFAHVAYTIIVFGIVVLERDFF